MNIIRRTVEIDSGTDARLTEMAAERGQVAVVGLGVPAGAMQHQDGS